MRVRPLLLTGLVGGALCVLLAVASALHPPALITAVPTGAPPRESTATPPPPEPLPSMGPLPGAEAATADTTVIGNVLSVLGIVVVVVAVIAVVLLAVRVAQRLAARADVAPIGPIEVVATVDPEALHAVLRRTREQIELDADANRAVIRCWEALEAVGAEAGLPRGESQTATEYVLGMLAASDAPEPPAVRLAELYGRALFSAERLPAAAVDDARSALALLEAALRAPAAGEGGRR